MTPEQVEELRRLREADDQWTFPKLMTIAVVTLMVAFSIIYIISSLSHGHQLSPFLF